MITVKENITLAPYTTFGIGGPAKFFCEVTNITEIKEALEYSKKNQLESFILGGGSNILISDSGFKGLVIKINIPGIEIISDSESQVKLKIGAGQNWDSVVKYAVDNNLWGIENLSHIPGNSGAFVVQNVGAYGQEAKDVVDTVEVFDKTTGEINSLQNNECEFGYRSSIFNRTQKDKYIIISITLGLTKNSLPNLNYGDLKKYFDNKEVGDITLEEIRNAIIKIRDTKFPFPKEAINGSAGSFFRGPVLAEKEFIELKENLKKFLPGSLWQRFENMTDKLKVPQGYKTPAGFLIEACNFKGLKVGGAQVNPDQAAIILNSTGKALAQDVITLYEQVKTGVFEKTGVNLEHEPEFVGF